MQRSDAPGQSPIKARRPRKVAALGAAAEHAQRWQELGDALDALVRALVANDALAPGLGRRVHGLWQAAGNAVLEVNATELRGEGRLALAADAQRGRFILPAYLAGVRLLAMREHSVVDDVLRLGTKLGELERGVLAQDAFADWLWSGGAYGFDVAQHACSAEIGQALLRCERPAAELWLDRSQQAVALWNDLSWAGAQQLDAGALAQRYAAPLARLERRIDDGSLALGLADAQALRNAADDPTIWARASIDVLLATPSLLAAVPRAHLTFHLLSLIEHGSQLDLGLLETIAALDGAGAGAPQRGGDAIDRALLGAAFGRTLLAHGVDPELLCAFADRADAALCEGMLSTLLDAGGEAAYVADAFACLLRHWGFDVFFACVTPRHLDVSLATTMLGVALAAGADARKLASVVEQLPIECALRGVCAHPNLLRSCAPIVARRIHADTPASGPLLADLALASAAGARVVGAVMLERQGGGFGPEALKAALAALVRVGLGAEFVMPLWETRAHASHVRLAALSALEGAPPLLAQVLGRRIGKLLEPPEIRDALAALRARAP